jgi:hypothetical protein
MARQTLDVPPCHLHALVHRAAIRGTA